MDRRNVTDHEGTVHEGLLNAHTGFLIELACGAGRYKVVHPYEQLDPARLTDAPLSCASCTEVTTAGPSACWHLYVVTRQHAEAILALADRHGYAPGLDEEALRLALLETRAPADRPTRELYPLITEHLTDMLTERALTTHEGTPRVLVEYQRHTGGTVQAPIGIGDRLMYDGTASGLWSIVEVTAVEDTPSGTVVTVCESGRFARRWPADEISSLFFLLDRSPRT
ncbi:hypothetical protein ACFZBU_42365 [Embleya sp. NPDC008237]|uniref:hypothetical protein n=1 Tax=Embleya sp. NPDC008237 TaxID=3363978 RepID=UPI0036F0872B